METHPDMCVLVWPDLVSNYVSGTEQWLVGWNPRGLIVVAAAIITAPTASDAKSIVKNIQKTLLGERKAAPSLAKTLKIIGRLRRWKRVTMSSAEDRGVSRVHSTSKDLNPRAESPTHEEDTLSPKWLQGDDFCDPGAREMRQRSDIWLELREGPTLIDLWCCGYRVQPCQLHVLRCSTDHGRLSVIPQALSITSRYGVSGVRKLMKGQQPLCVSGAQSALEGVILPEFMVPFTGPRRKPVSELRSQGSEHAFTWRGGRGAISETGELSATSFTLDSAMMSFAPDGDSPSAAAKARGDGGDAHSCENGLRGDQSSEYGGSDFGASRCEDSFRDDIFRDFRGISLTTPPANGCAPRLNYPVSDDYGELNILLVVHNTGRLVRAALESTMQNETSSPDCSRSPAESKGTPITSESAVSESTDKDSFEVIKRKLVATAPLRALTHCFEMALRVCTAGGRVSYTMHQAEFRCRQMLNWLALQRGDSKVCGLHPLIPHQISEGSHLNRSYCELNFVFSIVQDSVLGLLLAVLFFAGRKALVPHAQTFSHFFLYNVHYGYTEWFEGWPGGLKMNDDLNLTFSFCAKGILSLWNYIAAFRIASWNWMDVSYIAMTFVAMFGASFVFCFIADVCSLVTFHLHLLYRLTSLPFRLVRTMFNSLFLQFRGMKFNPLRNRTDVYDFGVDQMVIGTVLFTICIFLFPTIAIYYFYFALVRTSVWVAQEILIVLAFLVVHFPVYSILFWITQRGRMSGGVTISPPVIHASPQYYGGRSGRKNASSPERSSRHEGHGQGGSAGSTGVKQRLAGKDSSKYKLGAESTAHHEATSSPVKKTLGKDKDAEKRNTKKITAIPDARTSHGENRGTHSSLTTGAENGSMESSSPFLPNTLEGKSITVEMDVRPKPLPLTSAISDFLVIIDVLLSPLQPLRLLGLIFSGKQPRNINILEHLFPHLLTDCVSPLCTFCLERTDC